MVQEKDAAKKRVAQREALAERRSRELEENTIKFSWHVVEHTPGYTEWGYYGDDVPAKNVRVSPDFDNEADAQAWMGRHEPDNGKSLHIQRMRLLRRTYTDWVSY